MNRKQIDNIISKITGRKENLFATDVKQYNATLRQRLEQKSVLVIGGAGSIGSFFIKAILHYNIGRLYIIDTNENGLAELVRDIRSSSYTSLPEIHTYPIDFASPVFEKIYRNEGPFHIVANFAALKHVRTEKDAYAIEAMFDNNFVKANMLLRLLDQQPPERFFCVSTDKATNPVSIMGATKKLMEDVIFSYKDSFNITTARFANVAFSNGSLLDSYIHRFDRNQPIVCPADIKRFFVSPTEAGTLCMLACVLGQSGDIFIPKLSAEKDLVPFRKTVEAFFNELGIAIDHCNSEEEAKEKAGKLTVPNPSQYPVYLFDTDTSGEKPYEEFFTETDVVDWTTFHSLGAIKSAADNKADIPAMLEEAGHLFADYTDKEKIVAFLEKYIPGFSFIEKGKTLDQKM